MSGPVAAGSSYQTSDGRVVAGDDITSPGQWGVGVAVHRPGLPDAIASYRWIVGGPGPHHAVRISEAPLAPTLRRLAIVACAAGLAVVVAATIIGRRRRRGRQPTAAVRPDFAPEADEREPLPTESGCAPG